MNDKHKIKKKEKKRKLKGVFPAQHRIKKEIKENKLYFYYYCYYYCFALNFFLPVFFFFFFFVFCDIQFLWCYVEIRYAKSKGPSATYIRILLHSHNLYSFIIYLFIWAFLFLHNTHIRRFFCVWCFFLNYLCFILFFIKIRKKEVDRKKKEKEKK